MITEPFTVGNSLIHQLDPRLRIIFATLYSFVIALSNHFPTLFAGLGVSLVLIQMAHLNLWEVFKRLFLVNGLIFFFWIILPLTFEGEPLFSVGSLDVTREGVLLCARITLKSNAILMVFIALVATISLTITGHALNHLHVPEKIVYLLLLTYRYIFVIEQEYQRLVRAAKIRGFQPKTNLHTYKTYAYLIGMLFVRASERAERVRWAMLCRGFDGKFHSLYVFSFTRQDMRWAGLMLMAIMGLGYLEWMI